MSFCSKVKLKYQVEKILSSTKVFFKEFPNIEFPRELIDLGFKDESWHQDETALVTKQVTPKLLIGIWVFDKNDKEAKHRFYVVKYPTDNQGDYDSSTSIDVGVADTIAQVKELISKVKIEGI